MARVAEVLPVLRWQDEGGEADEGEVMSVKIIQVTDGGADEFGSVDEWADHDRHCTAESRKKMEAMVDAMPSGTVASFGGGWVLKDVKEVEFQ